MTELHRIQVALSGFPGGPGVSTFYGLDAATMLPEIKGLWAGLSDHMPQGVVVTYPVTGDIIEDTTGDLTGAWTAGALGQDTGNVVGVYSAPCGAVVSWHTGVVLDKHRVRGRTFVVPLSGLAYDDQGTLTTVVLTALRDIAQQKVATMVANFRIWHRPRKVATATLPIHDGGSAAVIASTVSDKVAVLRSRRD